jgi:2-keto-4-pentenoate hydratase/2-oxohepta-3-ene-1,7-dioic acid hydratase in catechol pathway
VMQQSRTSDLLFGPAEIAAYASQVITLLPGDLLLTGTPAGVGPLLDGDRVEVEIPGLGVLSNPVAALKA